MKLRFSAICRWLPRIMSWAFAGLLGLVAFSVFSAGYSFWLTLTSFILRLIPSLILGLSAFIAWRSELAGGPIFLLLGLVYYFKTEGAFLFKLPLTLIFILIGSLYLVSYYLSRQKKVKSGL